MNAGRNRKHFFRNGGAAGFTLLEIIIVVFIISLLAGIVFPSFYSFGNKVKSDARRMASLMRYLNDSAISGKQTYYISFDLGEGIVSWKDPDGEKTERLRSLSGIFLQSRGEVKEGSVTVFFGPLGMGENIEIRLKNGEEATTVAFNSLSGRAKITEDE